MGEIPILNTQPASKFAAVVGSADSGPILAREIASPVPGHQAEDGLSDLRNYLDSVDKNNESSFHDFFVTCYLAKSMQLKYPLPELKKNSMS